MTVYGTFRKRCATCDGTGKVTVVSGDREHTEECPICHGEGELESRSSQAAIKSARDARRRRG